MAVYYLDTSPKQHLYKSSTKVNSKQLTRLEYIKLDSSRIPLPPNSFPSRRLIKHPCNQWVGNRYTNLEVQSQNCDIHHPNEHRRQAISKSSLSSSSSNTSNSTNSSSVELLSLPGLHASTNSFSVATPPSLSSNIGPLPHSLKAPLEYENSSSPLLFPLNTSQQDFLFSEYGLHPPRISTDDNSHHTEHQSSLLPSSELLTSPPTSSSPSNSTYNIENSLSEHDLTDKNSSVSLSNISLDKDIDEDSEVSGYDWLSCSSDYESDSSSCLGWLTSSNSSLNLWDIEDDASPDVYSEHRARRSLLKKKLKTTLENFPYLNPLRTVGKPIFRARLGKLMIAEAGARRYERLPRSIYSKRRQRGRPNMISRKCTRNSDGKYHTNPESSASSTSTRTNTSSVTKKQRRVRRRLAREKPPGEDRRVKLTGRPLSSKQRNGSAVKSHGKPYIRITMCTFSKGESVIRARGCRRKNRSKFNHRPLYSGALHGKRRLASARTSNAATKSVIARPASAKMPSRRPMSVRPTGATAFATKSSPCGNISNAAVKASKSEKNTKATSKINEKHNREEGHTSTLSVSNNGKLGNSSSEVLQSTKSTSTIVRPTSSKRDRYTVNFLTATTQNESKKNSVHSTIKEMRTPSTKKSGCIEKDPLQQSQRSKEPVVSRRDGYNSDSSVKRNPLPLSASSGQPAATKEVAAVSDTINKANCLQCSLKSGDLPCSEKEASETSPGNNSIRQSPNSDQMALSRKSLPISDTSLMHHSTNKNLPTSSPFQVKDSSHSTATTTSKRTSKRSRRKQILSRRLGTKVEHPASLRRAAFCVVQEASRAKQKSQRVEQTKLARQTEAKLVVVPTSRSAAFNASCISQTNPITRPPSSSTRVSPSKAKQEASTSKPGAKQGVYSKLASSTDSDRPASDACVASKIASPQPPVTKSTPTADQSSFPAAVHDASLGQEKHKLTKTIKKQLPKSAVNSSPFISSSSSGALKQGRYQHNPDKKVPINPKKVSGSPKVSNRTKIKSSPNKVTTTQVSGCASITDGFKQAHSKKESDNGTNSEGILERKIKTGEKDDICIKELVKHNVTAELDKTGMRCRPKLMKKPRKDKPVVTLIDVIKEEGEEEIAKGEKELAEAKSNPSFPTESHSQVEDGGTSYDEPFKSKTSSLTTTTPSAKANISTIKSLSKAPAAGNTTHAAAGKLTSRPIQVMPPASNPSPTQNMKSTSPTVSTPRTTSTMAGRSTCTPSALKSLTPPNRSSRTPISGYRAKANGGRTISSSKRLSEAREVISDFSTASVLEYDVPTITLSTGSKTVTLLSSTTKAAVATSEANSQDK